MKTISQLIEELKTFPPNALVSAMECQGAEITIYHPDHATYGFWDKRSDEIDKPIGHVECDYDDFNRPQNCIVCQSKHTYSCRDHKSEQFKEAEKEI